MLHEVLQPAGDAAGLQVRGAGDVDEPELSDAASETFFLTQKLLPLIQDGGRILNVSTGLARFTVPGYAAYASMTALGRVGQADDIGPVVSSLLMDENRWVTGQRIEASGGMVL